MRDGDLRRNDEGYYDPTAYEAITNTDREIDIKVHRLLDKTFDMFKDSGFRIEGKIKIIDKKSGRCWVRWYSKLKNKRTKKKGV